MNDSFLDLSSIVGSGAHQDDVVAVRSSTTASWQVEVPVRER